MGVDDMQQRLLDKTKELERLQSQLERREVELEREHRAVEDLEAMMSTNGPMSGELAHNVAPEDYLDMLNTLENKVKLQELRKQQVLREVKETRAANRQIEERIAHLDEEATRIKAITGYVEPHKQMRRGKHVCSVLAAPDQRALLVELCILVSRVKCENKQCNELVRRKDKVLDALQAQEESFNELCEKMYSLHSQLHAQSQQLQKADDEYEDLRREHLKSDRTIARLESSNDSSTVQSLGQDNVFLRAKKDEHVEFRRVQDRVGKAQAFRFQHLKERESMVMNAIADLDMTGLVENRLKGVVEPRVEPVCLLDVDAILPKDEVVDVMLYELLSRDVEAINHSIDLKDIILYEKEVTIDSLAEKVESVLEHNNQETQLKHEDNINFEAEVIALNKEVRNERERYQQEIADLRRQKCKAQRKLSRVIARTSKRSQGRN